TGTSWLGDLWNGVKKTVNKIGNKIGNFIKQASEINAYNQKMMQEAKHQAAQQMVEQTKQIAAATKKLNELTEPIRQLSLKDRLVVSVATGAALLKGSATPENLIKDLQNFDPANTDPQVVFDSSIFSYYKGVLVFRHENLGSNFQIFQTIALNKNL